MKYLLTVSVHGILWSVFSLSVMLSKEDKDEFKVIFFMIFFYFAFLFARTVGLSKRNSLLLSIFSLLLFYSGQYLFHGTIYYF